MNAVARCDSDRLPMKQILETLSGFACVLLLGCGAGQQPTAQQQTPAGDVEARAGHQSYKAKNYFEAIDHYQRALELPRQSNSKSEVLSSIGNCYHALDQFDEALKYQDQAIAEDPKNHKAYVNAGVVYRLRGNHAKAKEMYNQALAIAPDYAELHASLGALCTIQGEHEEAVKHLEKAIALQPSLATAHANLALAYAAAGRFAEADERLKQAIVLGYENGALVRQRIDNLRQASEANPR